MLFFQHWLHALTQTPLIGNVVNVDVAIVGAGLSGLSSAKDLVHAGRSVVILEAKNRVGGKILNAHLSNGGVQEMGAEYVGPTQDRVIALAKELELETYETYTEGQSVVYVNGTATRFTPSFGFPPMSEMAQTQLFTIIGTLNEMASTVDVSKPWEHPQAEEWDSITLETWLAERVTFTDVRLQTHAFFISILGAETYEPSLLYAVYYIASAGNETTPGTLMRLAGTTDGAQERRIVGGSQLLAIKLAERFNILLSTAVTKIVCSKSYTLHTNNAKHPRINAKQVIIAMSPPLASRIQYEPPLPALRDKLSQHMGLGSIGKAIAIYDTPFWRHQNLSGQATSDSGFTVVTYDNSPPDGSYGALLGFIDGVKCRAANAMSKSEVVKEIQKSFVNYFGPEAAEAKAWEVQLWDNEPWIRGGPVAFAGPGVLTSYGSAIRQRVGGIHFAGTETSDYWVGYMDGAVRAGERAAKECIDYRSVVEL